MWRADALAGLTAARLHVPRKLARESAARALALDPRAAARQVRSAAGVVGELARVQPQAPDTRLNAPIGPDRLFAMGRASLDDVKALRRATGATVNDVLLTAVALMLSELLDDPPESVVALVPVSVRTENERGELGNRISTVFIDLPLRGQPLQRLEGISAAVDEVKGSAQVRAGALIVGGPRNQALTVGILSYDGGVHFGLLADRDAVPDVGDGAAGLERALAVLTDSTR